MFRFECPYLLAGDRITVHLTRQATAKKVVRAIQKLRADLGEDIPVISNRAQAVRNTVSHVSARGSNGWAHSRLAHTILHIGPDEYETLCLVNQVFGLANAIRLCHVDQFNQACGRNMGFRNMRGDHRHHALVSPALFEKIKDDLCAWSRYEFDVHADAENRYRVRRIRKGAATEMEGEKLAA